MASKGVSVPSLIHAKVPKRKHCLLGKHRTTGTALSLQLTEDSQHVASIRSLKAILNSKRKPLVCNQIAVDPEKERPAFSPRPVNGRPSTGISSSDFGAEKPVFCRHSLTVWPGFSVSLAV